MSRISNAPIGSKAFNRLLGFPVLVQDLLSIRTDEMRAEFEYRSNVLQGVREAMYVNDYGLRTIAARAKPPENWIHATIFEKKKTASIDKDLMMAVFGKKKSPA